MTTDEFKDAVEDLRETVSWCWIPLGEGGESGKDATALVDRLQSHDPQLAMRVAAVRDATAEVARYLMEQGA